MSAIDPVVTTEWLADHLQDPNLRVVDVRGHVRTRQVAPGVEAADYEGAAGEYLDGHIPGAVYLDWTSDLIDRDDPVPVQVASPEAISAVLGDRGIDAATHVIAVDAGGGQFATRLWWVLKYYGHDRVSVLDGGLNRWVAEGRPLETGGVEVVPRTFVPAVRPGWRTTAEGLARRLGQADFQLVDARDEGQYTGAKRRGPRGGHIPGAVHVPRAVLFNEAGGFPPVDEVRRRLEERGVTLDKPVVAYCNGGVAATVVLFNLFRLGHTALSNYDGSWNEWGAREDLPIERPA